MFKNIYDLREGETVYFVKVPFGMDEYLAKRCKVLKIDYRQTGKNLLRIQILFEPIFARDYGSAEWFLFDIEDLNERIHRDEQEAKAMAHLKNERLCGRGK